MKQKIKIQQKIYFLLFILFVIVGNGKVQGQASLGIGSSGLTNFPDTAIVNSNPNFSFYVKNTGVSTFSGTVNIRYSVNGTLYPTILYSNFYSGVISSDSVLINLSSLYFYGTDFTVNAINIVVVWPVASFVYTTDSISHKVFIADSNFVISPTSPTNIYEKENIPQLQIFPNPVRDNFKIINVKENEIKTIRIYDVTGSMHPCSFENTQINCTQLKKGIYILEVEFYDNRKKYLKFIMG